MRLINADKLKEAINSSLNTGRETFSPEIMCEAVDEQPTAFDVDKVVEQLKTKRQELLHYRKHRSISRVKLMRLKLQSKS